LWAMGYTCERANRLTSFNGDTVLYDDNGNMTSWGDATFTWDSRNRLIAISGTSLSASFKYDSMGRRVEKTVNGTTTKYLYDGLDIIMEMNGSGTPTAFYVRTLNIDEPLARIDLSSGEIRYYHADALGSVIALTDENATVVTQYNYSPFGQTDVTGTDSTGLSQPFRYTGREWDGDTGLYYYRARYYSPEMARFISEDPIGLEGNINMYVYFDNVGNPSVSINLYTYALNNPTNYIDPTGNFAQVLFEVTAAVLAGTFIFYAIYEAYINAHPELWEEEPPALPHIEPAVCHVQDPRILGPQKFPRRAEPRPRPIRPKRTGPVRPIRPVSPGR